MAMGIKPAGGRRSAQPLMAEINVTPMVDVMLVLLVIFMITAPIIKQVDALQVTLPQVQGSPAQTILTEDARTLQVALDGAVSRGDGAAPQDHYETTAALLEDLKAYRDDCTRRKKLPVVVIAGDRHAQWERIMQVWNSVKSAGIDRISFQVEPGGGDGPASTLR